MRLVSFVRKGEVGRQAWRCGALLPDGAVLDATLALAGELDPPVHYLDWFDLERPWLEAVRTALARASSPGERAERARRGSILDPAAVRWLAPVPRPGKIVAVGLNYRDHAAEAGLEVPAEPLIFAKFPPATAASGDSIVLPSVSRRVDFEAELVVVIGRRVRGVDRDEAARAVLGYCNGNDVSARDLQKRDGQWVRAKSSDGFAPMGPWLSTADEVVDPHALGIQLTVNGAVMQASNTRELIFLIPDLVAFIAQSITLEPGDAIFTGTPPGVGFARRPPVYLQPGDHVVVEIDGLGRLENTIVAPAATA